MESKRNNFIFVVIFLLIIFIVVYSVFRFSFSKKDVDKNEILVCLTSTVDKYNIAYKTSFKNGKVDNVEISYVGNNVQNDGYSSTISQIDYFCALKGSKFEYINNDLIIVIDREAYKLNKDDELIKSMFRSYDKLKIYYEKLGYICS